MGVCPSALCHFGTHQPRLRSRADHRAVFRDSDSPCCPTGSPWEQAGIPPTPQCGPYSGSVSFCESRACSSCWIPPLVPPTRAWCGRGRQEFPSTALILHCPDSPACSLTPGWGPGMRQLGTGGPAPWQGTAEGSSVGEGAQGGVWGHWLQREKILGDSFLLPCKQDWTCPRGLAMTVGQRCREAKGRSDHG